MPARVYVETYGCQMNVSDSELLAGVLAGAGWVAVDSVDDADVVLLNTCAVRERAEERIFGRLGWLKSAKRRRPGLKLGVVGCMAEHLKRRLIERAPYVDLVIGPDAYRRLPELLRAADGDDPRVDVRLDRDETYAGIEPLRQPGVSGWITVMRGCDKFCAFCVVPFTRGRERSVPADEVIDQAEAMERGGFREVTLLGQAVTSYRREDWDFARLLEQVHRATTMRLRFTSPYPTDFDQRVIDTLGALPRVGRHLHLPLQSGSDALLAAMGRSYDAARYLGLVEQIRRQLPGFALTTDIIVGFPGETDADFEKTLELVRAVRFDSAFMFKYSERSGTRAARTLADDVPPEVKQQRLERLLALQAESSLACNAAMVGRRVEVLVHGHNPRDEEQMMGRTSCFKPTVLQGGSAEVGELVDAVVTRASTHTLFARPTLENR